MPLLQQELNRVAQHRNLHKIKNLLQDDQASCIFCQNCNLKSVDDDELLVAEELCMSYKPMRHLWSLRK